MVHCAPGFVLSWFGLFESDWFRLLLEDVLDCVVVCRCVGCVWDCFQYGFGDCFAGALHCSKRRKGTGERLGINQGVAVFFYSTGQAFVRA